MAVAAPESDINMDEGPRIDRVIINQGNAAEAPRHVEAMNYFQHVENLTLVSDMSENHARASLSDPEAQGHVAEFLRICQREMLKNTQEKVIGTFKHLNNPAEQVNPNMRISDFYRGETALERNEYKPDDLFVSHSRREVKGQNTVFSDLHDDLDEGRCNYVALVADAGAGKTTLAKRYARMVKDGNVESLKDIELVHYVSFAQLDSDTDCTLFDLLFSQQIRGLDEKAKIYGRLWVEANPDKILFVFDGLDQATWKLEKAPRIGYDSCKKAPVLLYNLFHEDLLRDCRILITSREHAIIHFDADSRPQKTISLVGLSLKNMRFLIKKLAPEKGDEIIQHLEKKSPGLLSVCVSPMFLIFTVAILARDLTNAPSTLSGILIRVLIYFLSSKNQRVDKSKIGQVLEQLSKLAFDGTSRRRVLFTEGDMKRFGLDVETVQDLVITTPEKNVDDHYKLMEGSFKLFFCHQSVQEALTALEASIKPETEFRSFIWECLRQPHWEVVLRILLGVLLNPMTLQDAEKLTRVPAQTKLGQKEELKSWLAQVVQASQDAASQPRKRKSDDPLPKFKTENLCTLLYECGDEVADIVRDKVHHLVAKKALRADHLHAVAWVMTHCRPGVKVQFKSGNAGSSASLLSIGLQNCARANIEFTNWSLEINNQSMVENIAKRRIGKICLEIKKDILEPFEILCQILPGSTVEKLELSRPNKKVQTTSLLTDGQIKELQKIQDSKVLHLHIEKQFISKINNFSKEVCQSFGELANILKVEKLNLRKFCLDKDEIEALRVGTAEHWDKIQVISEEGVRGGGARVGLQEIKNCDMGDVSISNC